MARPSIPLTPPQNKTQTKIAREEAYEKGLVQADPYTNQTAQCVSTSKCVCLCLSVSVPPPAFCRPPPFVLSLLISLFKKKNPFEIYLLTGKILWKSIYIYSLPLLRARSLSPSVAFSRALSVCRSLSVAPPLSLPLSRSLPLSLSVFICILSAHVSKETYHMPKEPYHMPKERHRRADLDATRYLVCIFPYI